MMNFPMKSYQFIKSTLKRRMIKRERERGTFLMMSQQNMEHQPLTIADRINNQFLCCNLNWMNELKLLQIANHKSKFRATSSETPIPSAETIHNHKCDINIENYTNNLCVIAIYFRWIPLPAHTCSYPIRTLCIKCVNCLSCVLMEMHATHTSHIVKKEKSFARKFPANINLKGNNFCTFHYKLLTNTNKWINGSVFYWQTSGRFV